LRKIIKKHIPKENILTNEQWIQIWRQIWYKEWWKDWHSDTFKYLLDYWLKCKDVILTSDIEKLIEEYQKLDEAEQMLEAWDILKDLKSLLPK
jgi:hypothetical protein